MSIEDFPMDEVLAAEVVVRFKIPSIASRNDLAEFNLTFEQEVRALIESEGLFGIIDPDGNPAILSIKVWQS